MKKIILTIILLTSCGLPKPDCAKIGDTYDDVIKNCGKPDKFEYRNRYVSFINYYEGVYYLTIGFDKDVVNQIRYDNGKTKTVDYGKEE